MRVFGLFDDLLFPRTRKVHISHAIDKLSYFLNKGGQEESQPIV